MGIEIDPWSSEIPQDLQKLFDEFGLEKIPPELRQRFSSSRLFSKNIIVAHRAFGGWIKDADDGKEVAIMSGIKPSGEFHLGTKQTAEEIIFLQKTFGAKVFYCIADLEANADNGISLVEGRKNAISNVADLLALGLDEKKSYIYRQSKEVRVMDTAYLVSKRVTPAMMQAIYGEKPLGIQMAVMAQVGDILLPQHEDFGGQKQVVVPVGIDQDPHIRLARDLAFKEKLVPPCATYHKFIRNLKGEEKMSKRDPEAMLWLSEEGEDAKRKFMKALTGGRNTAEEQKKIGGDIANCVAYDIFSTHFENDEKKMQKRHAKCTKGKILCGECKQEMAEVMVKWLRKHQEKRNRMMKKAGKIISRQDE